MNNQYTLDDLYVSQSELEARVGIKHRDLKAFKINKSDYGYGVYEIINFLYQQYKEVRKLTGKPIAGEEDNDLTRLQISKTKEDVLGKQIKNQLMLGDLILKAEAQKRILGLLKSYNEMLEKFIHEASSATLPEDNRERVEFLTKVFNKIVTRVREDAMEVISWERDGTARLLSTRILDMRDKDDQEKDVLEYLKEFEEPTIDDVD